jgi:hypothetical protein
MLSSIHGKVPAKALGAIMEEIEQELLRIQKMAEHPTTQRRECRDF